MIFSSFRNRGSTPAILQAASRLRLPLRWRGSGKRRPSSVHYPRLIERVTRSVYGCLRGVVPGLDVGAFPDGVLGLVASGFAGDSDTGGFTHPFPFWMAWLTRAINLPSLTLTVNSGSACCICYFFPWLRGVVDRRRCHRIERITARTFSSRRRRGVKVKFGMGSLFPENAAAKVGVSRPVSASDGDAAERGMAYDAGWSGIACLTPPPASILTTSARTWQGWTMRS